MSLFRIAATACAVLCLLVGLSMASHGNGMALAPDNRGEDETPPAAKLRVLTFEKQDSVEIDHDSDVQVIVLKGSWFSTSTMLVVPHLTHLTRIDLQGVNLGKTQMQFLSELHMFHNHIGLHVEGERWEPVFDHEAKISYGLDAKGRQSVSFDCTGYRPYVYQLLTLRYVRGDTTIGYYQRFAERAAPTGPYETSLWLPALPKGAVDVEVTIETYAVPDLTRERTEARSRKYSNLWHLFTTCRPVNGTISWEIWDEVRGELGHVLDDMSIPRYELPSVKQTLVIPDEAK